ELPEERFTIVGCHDVFEHVPDPVELMVRFVTHLEPGGLLCTSLDLFNPIPTHRPANDFYATIYDSLLKHLGLELVIGKINSVLDSLCAGIRVYKRTRPATLSVAEEYLQNGTEAYAFVQQELQQLSDRLNAELDMVTRKGPQSRLSAPATPAPALAPLCIP
ncbi:MAG TPA: methyltransferase domain-containing protein, partial [Chthonomonadaceae bacterium]|nr:methyltransferase domain-containing protein [Chthonomonadaceae bacterium]